MFLSSGRKYIPLSYMKMFKPFVASKHTFRIFSNKSLPLLKKQLRSSDFPSYEAFDKNSRFVSTINKEGSEKNYYNDKSHTDTTIYLCSAMIAMFGFAYAAVPLYKIFCQQVGLGGDPKIGHKIDKLETMTPIRQRRVKVKFLANNNASIHWNFKPVQDEITVVPGETALAFYTAKNPTDEPIVGIATYNVVPFKAGLYFNKIQCFCFEEQWLNPNEEVDMPIFFFIDPDFDDDADLAAYDEISLSYTFFKAEKGMNIPLPGFMQISSAHS